MSLVIGTAGHIDHGKTSLVKALTGQDTDRLKEEKDRGISIDLGFAHFDLPDGTRAGVVDVPGHERFIRNMLAGAHGIDLALFTVAADDGVMPQTEEHLDIVHLLGIRRAIFVITKVDLVDAARVADVKGEIGALISGTRYDGSPMIPCSVVSGEGLDALRARIADMLQALSGSGREGAGLFRLPVDRVFLLHGHGLVVTGTALGGEVRAGDHVRCLPGGQSFRVRSVQVHNEPVSSAHRGQRVALNLTGHERPSIERGDVICDERLTMTTARCDARVELRPAPGERRPSMRVEGTATTAVRSHQRVRVHLGTAERMATLILLGPDRELGPTQSAFCQLALADPLVAMRGDRFIIRDETAQRTLGGGVVVDAFARRHARREAGLLDRLERLWNGSLADALAVTLAGSGQFALSVGPLCQMLNAPADGIQQVAAVSAVTTFSVDGETFYAANDRWSRLREHIVQSLAAFHAAKPLFPGMDMEAAREGLEVEINARLFRAVADRLDAESSIVRDGSVLRLPTHSVRLRDEDRMLTVRVAALVGREPFAPPDLKQIEQAVGLSRSRLAELLKVMERERSIVRVSSDLYFDSGAIEQVRAGLRRHLSGRGDITPATFRDLFGTTRKYAIPLLEYLDREGITIRVGDARRLKN
jgi:selenocysteine-specific elongation factor